MEFLISCAICLAVASFALSVWLACDDDDWYGGDK